MKKDFILNLIANILSFAANAFIVMWLTPFVMHELGAANYGYIPLAQNLVNYMMIVAVVLNSMTSRFFTYSVKQNRLRDSVEYINTTFFAGLILCAVLAVAMLTMILHIDRIIVVRPRDLSNVQLLFVFVGIGGILTAAASSFGTAAFCTNKVYISSTINMGAMIVRVIFTVGLMLLFPPAIWFVALANLAYTLFIAVFDFVSFKKLMPHIRIRRKYFNREKLGHLVSAGVWNAVNQLGTMLFQQTDVIVANRAFDPDTAGEYAALLQFSTFLTQFAIAISVAFAPVLVTLYAQGKVKEMVYNSNRFARILGIFLVLPIAAICGLGESVLTVWLGPNMAKYHWLLMLMTLHLSVNLVIYPIAQVQMACNKVRTPAIVTAILGAVSVGLSWCFVKYTPLGVYGIALAGAIVLTCKNLLFIPMYNARITGQKLFAYTKSTVPVAITAVIMSAIALMADKLLNIDSFIKLVGTVIVLGIIYLPVVWWILLKKNERIEAIETVKKILDNVKIIFGKVRDSVRRRIHT